MAEWTIFSTYVHWFIGQSRARPSLIGREIPVPGCDWSLWERTAVISRQLLRQLILCWVRLSGGACITRVGNVGTNSRLTPLVRAWTRLQLIKAQNMPSYVELL